MFDKHLAVATFKPWRGCFPLLAALRKLSIADVDMNRARGYVDCDCVTCSHKREIATHVGLRNHMQYACAITGAAHARIADAQHIPHTLLHELQRYRNH